MKNIFKLALLALCVMPGVIFSGKDKDTERDKKKENSKQKPQESYLVKIRCPHCGYLEFAMYHRNRKNDIFCSSCKRVFDAESASLVKVF